MDHWLGVLAPQLQALVVLADHDGHMTRAAAALGVPQSSMSRRIHALETELTLPLLVHAGRTVRLTPAARGLAQRVRSPLRDIELAVEEAVGAADADHGTVRFGFPLTMGTGRIPDLISDFRRAHRGITVTLKQAPGSELADDLEAGRLDLAVTIPPPARLHHSVIGAQEVLAALPRGHRLARAGRIALADLRDETFIANPASYHLRGATEQWCSAAGFTPAVAFEVTEFGTIRELVARGLGVALLPHDDRAPSGVVEVPLRGDHRRAVALASATALLAPAARRLRDFIVAR
ncbi:Transcriptional regulator, LysR family OS=Tsukamurella paurometabola (strain ATCC 8368 / DSM/ CCUG 35730 / CIP 100753 / JCM 10117 / KCTC 9821 / NBRC 16120/ NCIMB 702349 / NCTC 13040) OX=521096 GN=Tpau_1275 PE=3 SV=1 [Tsukamurella paurometabola]|uniref:Transcriptional regulator, LysR family n=1 Tax=Tsukamurella paurometabola (strain ATCC 8368 / DSM 20162 / CCUG 35730 / CIP 100753 / JCM 10117 / KCTC 9821 / NBRC 16120 / NCIMB 702349 / NCTC 13040) TaxID=521096 RepID=D5UWN4_TSUPD|nr:LysR substrate-binding domain-containing protein [Tsukamurella paurometabola]ADG77906.1 transcriptional regulator, LysR family [Tsukamurella paurometabola DSM 20162]SUP29291.1 HTH-type transcriptional regulator gltC [Tsukamurella paurometabola]